MSGESPRPRAAAERPGLRKRRSPPPASIPPPQGEGGRRPEEGDEAPLSYRITTWKGLPNYECALCPYSTLDPAAPATAAREGCIQRGCPRRPGARRRKAR